MSFKSQLIEYMDQIGCSSKDLSRVSGLSTSSISRYRSGDRKPPVSSNHIKQIAEGLCKLAKENGVSDFESPHRVTQSLIRSINKSPFIFDFTSFRTNFADLVNAFGIELKDLAPYVDLDETYLSGILSGKRQPAGPGLLVNGICDYVTACHSKESDKEIAAYILACEPKEISGEKEYYDALHYWLNTTQNDHRKSAARLLHAIDDYSPSSYEQYLDEPHSSGLFEYPADETIYDPSKFKAAEIAFINSLETLESGSSVFIYNDLSFRTLEQNGSDFSQLWKVSLARALAKNIKINIVLNVDVPFKRVLYNLEQWLPFFMTGNLYPYYLKGVQSSIFNHILMVSDKFALTAESVVESPDLARYRTVTDPVEISHLKARVDAIMSRALPLIETYTAEEFPSVSAKLSKDALLQGEKRAMTTSVPLFMADDSFIEEICRKNGIAETDISRILQTVIIERNYSDISSRNGELSFVINHLSEETFEKYPSSPILSYSFPGMKLKYSYSDYIRHLEQAEKYASSKNKINISFVKSTYYSIQILVHKNKFVFVSKLSAPTIVFACKHPKLCKAIEGLAFPNESV